MAEGRSNQAICDRLSMARKTVEAHIATIFSKLELLPTSDDHRRCLPCSPTCGGRARRWLASCDMSVTASVTCS